MRESFKWNLQKPHLLLLCCHFLWYKTFYLPTNIIPNEFTQLSVNLMKFYLPFLHFSSLLWVGLKCLKFDCSTINWSTLLAGNQLLNTKFINCSNPVNPGSTGFKQLTKKWQLVNTVEQLTLLSSATYKKSIFYL